MKIRDFKWSSSKPPKRSSVSESDIETYYVLVQFDGKTWRGSLGPNRRYTDKTLGSLCVKIEDAVSKPVKFYKYAWDKW